MHLFATDCVSSDGPSIGDMVDAAQDISWDECWKFLDREEVHKALGYGASPHLTLESDWSVPAPCRSTYRGAPCIFITHSCIEYVYVAPEDYARIR